MIEIRNNAYSNCLSCGSHKNLFVVKVGNKHGQGTELSLCKECCATLKSLLGVTQIKGIKMCSIEELDKVN